MSRVVWRRQNKIFFFLMQIFATHSLNELVSGVIGCRVQRLPKNHRRRMVQKWMAQKIHRQGRKGKKSGKTMFRM